MSERLTEDEDRDMRLSKSLEKAWRVYTRPLDYTREERQIASDLLKKQIKELGASMKESVGANTELYEQIFTGIFHHSLTPPPEIKYKDPHRN